MNEFVKEIVLARKELGLSLRTVSNDTGLTRSYISEIEKGMHELSPKYGLLLCHYYGIDTQLFMIYSYEQKKKKVLKEIEALCMTKNIDFPDELSNELNTLRCNI